VFAGDRLPEIRYNTLVMTEQTSHRYPRARKLTGDELAALAQLDSRVIDALAQWVNKRFSCSDCLKCSRRCEVLQTPGLHIGEIEALFNTLQALDKSEHNAALSALLKERPELYAALRTCCFCGHCTAPCLTQMNAPEVMRAWRELFANANLMPPDDSKMVMVDNEWHIFSAYRAVYGIAYPEFIALEDLAGQAASSVASGVTPSATPDAALDLVPSATPDALPGAPQVDTLFFPGCSLVSYAPEVVRTVGAWLDEAGIAWALSLDCCGSPLMSAGLFERSLALREKVLAQVRACGIKRVITICPGCGEELAEIFDEDVDIVPLTELLLQQGETAILSRPPVSTETVTIFDSCHDRWDGRHGTALRQLISTGALGNRQLIEMPHHGKDTLCCGAGGAVAAFDPVITQNRVQRVLDEAAQTGAKTVLTVCPTCTYTLAQALLAQSDSEGIECRHYLELLFDLRIPWREVFAQLEQMWSGEYGPWLAATFF
jgi:Fe-S oxidoreductase